MQFRLLLLILLAVWPALAPACDWQRVVPSAPWASDHGPNPHTKEGKALLDLMADLPFLPGISQALTGGQKFRPAFGPVVWRLAEEYPVQILFQGQDATHIAEAAGRPATAAFGGRAQDLAAYFGVDQGAGFFNVYPYTIKGQYGAFDVPYVYFKDGKPEIRYSSFVDNQLWMLTHQGAHAEWRKNFYEELIRQNPHLKMLVLFGGASRDAAASFINSAEGGSVGTRVPERDMRNIQMPETQLKFAGGNNEFPVLVGSKGQDLYSEFLGRALEYDKKADQDAAIKALKENPQWFLDRMVFTKGGPYGNGLLHPGQLGGFDFKKMKVGDEKTISLKGLVLSDGTEIPDHVLVAQFPHPSALSRMTKEKASQEVGKTLKAFAPYVAQGWEIVPDPGMHNQFAAGQPYLYGRTSLPRGYYSFGTPKNRQVEVSSASRRKPWGIVFGSREKNIEFDDKVLEAARNSQPSEKPDPRQIWTNHQRTPDTRYIFDNGPGTKWEKLMVENLPLPAIFAPKPGKSWQKDGIAAFNVKNHPDAGPFGHYRGTFEKPKVFVLADPHGVDDAITSMALTGARGQYLHGIMEDAGVGDQYLVLKTVPFRMDGANRGEWGKVLEQTAAYREKIIAELMKQEPKPLIVADGPWAKAELKRILGDKSDVVALQRGEKPEYGIRAGGETIARRLGSNGKISAEMRDIPRTHLPYTARYWEGRGGDHVFTATDRNEGQAFVVVAPAWATEQKMPLDPETQKVVDEQIQELKRQGLRLPGESVPEYLARRAREQQAP